MSVCRAYLHPGFNFLPWRTLLQPWSVGPFAPVTEGAECLVDDEDDDDTFRETSPHVLRRQFSGECTPLLVRSGACSLGSVEVKEPPSAHRHRW